MSTDTLEKPVAKPQPKKDSAVALPARSTSILNTDRLQALVDSVQRDLNLPSVVSGITPMSDLNDEHGNPIPLRACELDSNGDVIFGSGVVVTDAFTHHLESILIPRVEQQVHRTLAMMTRSLDAKGTGVVQDRAKPLLPIPDNDWA